MTESLEALLKQCESDLRAGQARKVARHLGLLNSAEIPRPSLLSAANIARRAGCLSLGLRLLSPLIYPERNKWRDTATDQELAEYATLLQSYGSVEEALQILKRVDPLRVPEALLYRAICHFNRWEYGEAIRPLERYLESDISDYARLVGRVNLASALLETDQTPRAMELIDGNIRLSKSGGHARLQGNCLEMRSQLHILSGDYDKAFEDLRQASALLGLQLTHDRLYVEKWNAVAKALKENTPKPLWAFREKAHRAKHWETLREVDLFLLKVEFNQERFDRLIFGTPYVSYRWRICRLLDRTPASMEYLHGSSSQRIFDLATGKLNGETIVNPGKKIHQVIEVLTRDLYAPIKIGGLFAELFPGEYFDIHSSTLRVHQVLRRARRWMERHDLPLKIHSSHGYYSLSRGENLSILIPFNRPEISTFALEFKKLCQMIPEREFSPGEAREKLQLSATSFNRLIRWSLERKLLARHGQGRAVKYRVA